MSHIDTTVWMRSRLFFTWGAKQIICQACSHAHCITDPWEICKSKWFIRIQKTLMVTVSHKNLMSHLPHLETHQFLWCGYFTQGFSSFQSLEMSEALNTKSFPFASNVSEGTSKNWATASITDSGQGFHKRAITPRGSIARVRMAWHPRNPQPGPEVFFGNF